MLIHEGKSYVRVSEVLKPFNDFSGIDPIVLNNKANLGTRVHQAINDEINGEFPIITPDIFGYIQSFHKWRELIEPTFLESEMRYYDSAKMLTGCIDTLIQLKGEEKAILVDFKTSAQESPTVWPMQAHLYQYLLSTANKIIAPRFLFLKLAKDGDFPKVCQYRFDLNILRKCLCAIDEFWNKDGLEFW